MGQKFFPEDLKLGQKPRYIAVCFYLGVSIVCICGRRGKQQEIKTEFLLFVSSVNKVVEETSEFLVKCQCSAYDFTLLENALLDIDLF